MHLYERLDTLRRSLLGSVPLVVHPHALLPAPIVLRPLSLFEQKLHEVRQSTPFGTPLHIARRYSIVERDRLELMLATFLALTGYADDGSVAKLAEQKIHAYRVSEFRSRLWFAENKKGEDARGKNARAFYNAQILHPLLGNTLDQNAKYPPLVGRVFSDAADGFFELARPQFECLARLVDRLADWIAIRGFRQVVLVESPIGNSLPTQVMRDLCLARELPVEVCEWGFPRNDKVYLGNTVKSSIKSFAEQPLVKNADFVLLLDDITTGVRIMKLAEGLRKEIGPLRFGAVGMAFRFDPRCNKREDDRKNLKKLHDWAAEAGLPFAIESFPSIASYRIDLGGLCCWPNAMAWADHDLIAGKRKVNLIFNLIDHYERIVEEVKGRESSYLRFVAHVIWRQNTGYESFKDPYPELKVNLDRVFHTLDLEVLFRNIRERARVDFPRDYAGIFDMSPDEVRRRSEWLERCIYDQLKDTYMSAGLLNRVVTEAHQAGLDDEVRRAMQNNDYAYYTLPWCTAVLALNRRLRERIIASI